MHRAKILADVMWGWARLPWLDVLPDQLEAQQWIDLWIDYPELRDTIRSKLKSRAYGLMYGMRDFQPVAMPDML